MLPICELVGDGCDGLLSLLSFSLNSSGILITKLISFALLLFIIEFCDPLWNDDSNCGVDKFDDGEDDDEADDIITLVFELFGSCNINFVTGDGKMGVCALELLPWLTFCDNCVGVYISWADAPIWFFGVCMYVILGDCCLEFEFWFTFEFGSELNIFTGKSTGALLLK